MSQTTSTVAEEPGAKTGDGETTDDSGYQGNVKKIQYHREDLEKIFKDEDDGWLAGRPNIDLAKSFVHSRKRKKEEAKRKQYGTNQATRVADGGNIAAEDEEPGPSSETNAQAKRSATDDNCPSESKVPKMSHDEGEGL